MKFKTGKNNLLSGMQVVQNVISTRSALPILSNILIETQQGSIKLTATDLDIGISCVIPLDIQEAGAITIPAKRFHDIIKELPGEEVCVNTKKNNLVTIDSCNCQFKIMGLPKEEFPKLPELKDKKAIRIEQVLLKQMIGLTSFAASFEETKYILNGTLFRFDKKKMHLVATDGKRLAFIEKELEQEYNQDTRIIVPIKTIHELSRNLKDEGDLLLTIGDNQVLFDLGGTIIISRLIEGEFPDYPRVIPPPSENKVKADRSGFLLAVKRAALLSTPDYQAVKLELFKNKMVVSKSTPDIGESREELEVEYYGKEMMIGFNPVYLTDVLKSLDEEYIDFEISDSEKPGVIRVGQYVYMVLPMRLS